jgi:DNA-binding LytR/AlgR family response regulator
MKKILIIEDDSLIIDSIQDLFEYEGYEVFLAGNGSEGITSAKKNLPDIIVSDIAMPGISGYDVLRELQIDETTVGIPFIFLTAKVEKSDFRLGMELGADDYITKPFKLDELLRAVETRIRKNEEKKSHLPVMLNEPERKLSDEDHIFIQDKNHPAFIKVENIMHIAAEAEYSNIFLSDGKKILIRRLLKKWETMLPDKSFLRISRSAIINLNHLAKIEKWFNNSYVVYMKGAKEPLIISRRYAVMLRSRLK